MNSRKVFFVATTEFGSVVRTKAFLVTVFVVPLLVGGVSVLGQVVAKWVDVTPRAFAVLDRTGQLDSAIESAARARNDQVAPAGKKPTGPTFLPTKVAVAGISDEQVLLELSDQVRSKKLFAFVEIPADILALDTATPSPLRYYSNEPSYLELEMWLRNVVQGEARVRRLAASRVDPKLIGQIDKPIPSESLGLLARVPAAGRGSRPGEASMIKAAEKVDRVRAFGVPAILVAILYIAVMSAAPVMLTSVIEEKMSKISEILLGSVTSMELMMGKMIGNVGVALTLGLLYVVGACATAVSYGYGDAITPGVLGLLVFFVVTSVFLFGSMFLAVGSACSELKDSQSMMVPVMILTILPVTFLPALLQNPTGKLAVALSLFPTSAPYVMLMRMVMTPAPPAWQVALSITLMVLTTILSVWAASRIFRVGLLMQGKAPSLVQMVKWVWAS